MDKEKLKGVLECLLFVTNRPLPLAELSDVAGESPEEVQALIQELKQEMEARKSALQIAEVGEGYQFASKEGYGYWVKKLFREQATFRLSQSALETLSIIAYKQPITRAEIEEIRGVEVTGVLETLIERRLAKVAGRKESVGRPLLYGTTPEFLRHFNLWKISDLPSLEDLAKEAEMKREAEVNAPPSEPVLPDSNLSTENSSAETQASPETAAENLPKPEEPQSDPA